MADAPRYAYAAFAASLGAGLALVAYRFAMQPLAWDAPAKNVLQIGAPVLPIAMWQLLRQYERMRWPWPLVLLSMVLGAGVAFGAAYVIVPPPGSAKLATYDLPGFGIGLPPGNIKQRSDSFSTGKLELVDVAGTGGVVAVEWEPGAALDQDDLKMMEQGLSTFASGSPTLTKIPGPAGTEVDTIAFESPKGAMWTSIIVCGSRRVSITTGGDSFESLHRRIVASFACRPGSAPEAGLDHFPLALDLPAEWHKVPSDPAQIQLTDDTRGLILKEVPGNLKDLDEAREFMTKAFEAGGVHVTFGDLHDGRFPFTGSAGSDSLVGWIWPFECGDRSVIVMGLVADQASADALAELVRGKAHCAGPNETVRFK
jgi:hypothetical protein